MMKNKRQIILFLLCICSLPVLVSYGWYWYQQHWGPYAKANVIRLHIIANSNNPWDQALKYKVRDEIIRTMAQKFSGTETKEQARAMILQQKEQILAVAEQVVQTAGYHYPVTMTLGEYAFPDRTYHIAKQGQEEDLTFPAGEYEAVRLIIGKGQGANWWCVLFPPLCFVGQTTENPPVLANPTEATSQEKAKETMDKEAGQNQETLLAASPRISQPVVCKSKLAELLGETKIWWQHHWQ